ncbi:MAG: galactose mutarotase, partial [Polyangiaceae bacterium]
YAWRGAKGALKQHGFARNVPWEVAGKDARSVTLRLGSSDEIRREYPWNFSAEYTYTLATNSLRIGMTFTNESDSPMPFGAGFHPYFAVAQADKASARVETNATRAFDNVTKKTDALGPIALTAKEVDLHLIDHTGDCTLRTKTHAIRLRGSPEFSRWVVWTLAGKDFVCVEPWTCPGNALNTGESLIVLERGARRTMWVEYALV